MRKETTKMNVMSNKCFYDYEDQIFGFEMAKPKKMEYTQEDIMFIDRPQSLNGQSPKSAEQGERQLHQGKERGKWENGKPPFQRRWRRSSGSR